MQNWKKINDTNARDLYFIPHDIAFDPNNSFYRCESDDYLDPKISLVSLIRSKIGDKSSVDLHLFTFDPEFDPETSWPDFNPLEANGFQQYIVQSKRELLEFASILKQASEDIDFISYRKDIDLFKETAMEDLPFKPTLDRKGKLFSYYLQSQEAIASNNSLEDSIVVLDFSPATINNNESIYFSIMSVLKNQLVSGLSSTKFGDLALAKMRMDKKSLLRLVDIIIKTADLMD